MVKCETARPKTAEPIAPRAQRHEVEERSEGHERLGEVGLIIVALQRCFRR